MQAKLLFVSSDNFLACLGTFLGTFFSTFDRTFNSSGYGSDCTADNITDYGYDLMPFFCTFLDAFSCAFDRTYRSTAGSTDSTPGQPAYTFSAFLYNFFSFIRKSGTSKSNKQCSCYQ